MGNKRKTVETIRGKDQVVTDKDADAAWKRRMKRGSSQVEAKRKRKAGEKKAAERAAADSAKEAAAKQKDKEKADRVAAKLKAKNKEAQRRKDKEGREQFGRMVKRAGKAVLGGLKDARYEVGIEGDSGKDTASVDTVKD